MYWHYRNEMKRHVSQAVSELKMVEYIVIFGNMKKLLKIVVSDKNCLSDHTFANINSIIRLDVPKLLSWSW